MATTTTPRLTRSKSFTSFDFLRVEQVQDKVARQSPKVSVPKRPKRNSLRIIVLKKNYRKRLVEEINEKTKKRMIEEATQVEVKVPEPAPKIEKKFSKLNEIFSRFVEKAEEPIGKLSGSKGLLKPSKLEVLDTKPSSSPLRPSKSFSGTTKPLIEVRKQPKPSFEVLKPKRPHLLIPPTPTKQKPQLAQSDRVTQRKSLFQGKNQDEKLQEVSKTKNFYQNSSHTAKLNEISEKLKYVRQLEKEFNENKLKRQMVEAVEGNEEKKSRKRLSFGKSPLQFLMGGGRKE